VAFCYFGGLRRFTGSDRFAVFLRFLTFLVFWYFCVFVIGEFPGLRCLVLVQYGFLGLRVVSYRLCGFVFVCFCGFSGGFWF